MKVTFEGKDGKTQTESALFGRCVKIQLANAKENGTVSLTIEHKPQYTNDTTITQGTLCARIEGVITHLPKPGNKNHTPGFTATLKIFNDFSNEIGKVLDTKNKYLTDFAGGDKETKPRVDALRDYVRNKFWVVVWVGYWNEDKKDADYIKVYTGLVNSYYSYRRGVDLITEMQCANVYPEKTTTEQMNLMFGSGPKGPKTAKDPKESVSEGYVNETGSDRWHFLLWDIINKYDENKVPIVDTSKASPIPIPITEEDRKKSTDKWFTIEYASDALDGNAKQAPSSLVKNYYSARTDRDYLLDDIMTIFPNVKVTYKVQDDYAAGKRRYVILPAAGNRAPTKIGGNTHTIYDYQNLLDAPMMSGNGGMTINMLLRPEIDAWDWIELRLTDKNKNGNSIGISGDGGQFNMLLYGDRSQTIKSAVKNNDKINSLYRNGGVFNKPFLIYKVVHTFSTHSNIWKTTITTVPMVYQQGV